MAVENVSSPEVWQPLLAMGVALTAVGVVAYGMARRAMERAANRFNSCTPTK